MINIEKRHLEFLPVFGWVSFAFIFEISSSEVLVTWKQFMFNLLKQAQCFESEDKQSSETSNINDFEKRM